MCNEERDGGEMLGGAGGGGGKDRKTTKKGQRVGRGVEREGEEREKGREEQKISTAMLRDVKRSNIKVKKNK